MLSAAARVVRPRAPRDPRRLLSSAELPAGFQLVQRTQMPTFEALRLRHAASGAEHIHLANDDSNRAFSVVFKTPVDDSTGLPHILEHTVLCGSERYPVRDPFFKMLTRSVNTFMNALTGHDYTMYPFATTNARDFDNLLDVYLDASFFPLLREADFWQEGHRIEPTDGDGLEFKGVVLNEMKGVLSDPGTLFAYKLEQLAGYPAVSGGDPACIPDLAHADLVAFHASRYQPGNALFYSYGDLDLPALLTKLDERVLSACASGLPQPLPPLGPVAAPGSVTVLPAPPDSMGEPGRQARVCCTRMTHPSDDQQQSQLLSFVSRLLLNGVDSPLYEALIGSQVGAAYAPGTGFHGNAPGTFFAVGLEGVREGREDEARAAIQAALQRVAAEGFDARRVEAALHQLELGERAVDVNEGINVLYPVARAWAHGADPLMELSLRDLAALKERLAAEPDLPRQVVADHLLMSDDTAFTLVMTPDDKFVERQQAEEAARLAATDVDVEQLTEQAQLLARLQEAEPDVDCLPTLALADIPRRARVVQGRELRQLHGAELQLVGTERANGFVHLRLAFDASQLSDEELLLLPLLTQLLTAVGAGDWDHKELAVRSQLCCGGVGADLNVTFAPDELEQTVVVAVSCLEERLPAAADLLARVLAAPGFAADPDHLAGLVNLAATNAASGVVDSGHAMALKWASAGLSAVGRVNELSGGLTQVRTLQSLKQQDPAAVGAALQVLASTLFSRATLSRSSVVAAPGALDAGVGALDGLLAELPSDADVGLLGLGLGLDLPRLGGDRDFVPLPIDVNFVAAAYPSVRFAHPDYAPLRVLARVLGSRFLHREIREKGGAYGAMSVQSASGVLGQVSYYDPNRLATLEAYGAGAAWSAAGGFSDQDVEEALLSTFGDIDSPQAPPALGSAWFLRRLSDEMRQAARDRLFAVNKDAVVDVAQRYLVPGPAAVAIIGAADWEVPEGWEVRGEFSGPV